MNEDKLLELCFSLAEELMWEEGTAPVEQQPAQVEELSKMTEDFIEISKKHYYQVEDLDNGDEILFGAIRYLRVQAIPPLRGNTEWFDYSLSTLLELCNPNSRVDMDTKLFLLSLSNGIDTLLRRANESDNE